MTKKTRKNLLLLALIVSIGALFIYFINSQSNTPTLEEVPGYEEEQEETDTLIDSEIRAQVKGYYRQEERGAGEMFGDETFMCDQLVITEGGEEFSQEYRDMIADGNTVNQLDANGNLILNLDLEAVGESKQAEIKASTEEEPVMVDLRKVEQGLGHGVSPCYSFVEIIS